MCQEIPVKNAFSLMRWRLMAVVAILLAAVGPLSALSAEAAGPVTWNATVGYSSRDQAIQSNFYFPNNITIDKGDRVTWSLKSGEFFTITFLTGTPPPPFVINGPNGPELNPAALDPAGGSSYNGTVFTNSGLIAAPGQTYTLTFNSVGTYNYNCLVHTPMTGSVKVQPAGTPYPHSQTYYNAQATAAEVASIGQGYALEALGLANALSLGVGHVTAGIGKFYSMGSIGVVRFLPQVAVVRANQTVTWNNRDPEFPHTITFNLDFPNPLASFFPSKSVIEGPNGGSATMSSTSQPLNSGVIVKNGPFGTQFSVEFTTPSTNAYHCELHDQLGMTGVVVVLPGS